MLRAELCQSSDPFHGYLHTLNRCASIAALVSSRYGSSPDGSDGWFYGGRRYTAPTSKQIHSRSMNWLCDR